MKIWIVILFLLFPFASFAEEELDGTFTETGSERTYTVNLQNDNGHVYLGTATLLQPGTVTVSVTDGNGERYTGFATGNEFDGYDILLKSPVSGHTLTGSVDVNEF